jgi:hypothetical protein
MNVQQMEEKLWEYIDGSSNEDERARVKTLLNTHSEWQKKFQQLIAVHQMLNSTEMEMPSLRFTQNVMESITKLQIAPATKSYIDKKIIYSIGGFFLTMIVGLLVYSFGQINWQAGPGSIGPVDFNKIQWNELFNNTYTKIFMMINVILALMILDKYLNSKKDQARQKTR